MTYNMVPLINIEKQESRTKAIRQITWIGFVANIVLSTVKIIAGVLGDSQAIIADGIHSLSDTITDIAVIVGSYYWSKPADINHPYGHQRMETLVSFFIGCMLIFAGIIIVYKAVVSTHDVNLHPPSVVALFAAAISIIVKEILYRWTQKEGKKLKSLSLVANAWHHRLDAISSIPALIAVGIAIVFPSWDFIDQAGAIFVSALIFQAAVKIILNSLRELIDTGATTETCEKIKNIALTNTNVVQVHQIRTRYSANSLHVILHVVVDGSLTVFEGHNIAEDVKARILKDGPDVIDVEVHIEPLESAVVEEETCITDSH